MLSFQRIVVATDYSSTSDIAVAWAEHLAREFDGTVDRLHIEVLYEREAAAALLAGEVEAPDEDDYANVVLRAVTAAPAIREYVEKEGADLLVVGSHGRRGLRRMLLGSVAEELVRTSPCPVLVAKANANPSGRVLAPIDFSAYTEPALVNARRLAAAMGLALDVVHVIEDAPQPAVYGPAARSLYQMDPDLNERTMAHMKSLYEGSGGPEVEVQFLVETGRSFHDIPRIAEERRSDLIIMPTHGLTGLSHALIGSVAERVIRRAPCPVLVFRPSA
ncbi:MAG: universal stress protein [Bacteroidota bacterium]